jgi:sortase A
VNALAFVRKYRPVLPPTRASVRGKLLWTVGNLLMLLGLYLLLYVGGLFADEQFNLIAAQGDSTIRLDPVSVAPVQPVVAPVPTAKPEAPARPVLAPRPVVAEPTVAPTAAPQRFVLPQLNNPGGGRELNSLVPAAAEGFGPSTLTRILIPDIGVDRKVEEVGWRLEELEGQQVAIWEVAKYTVGHHQATANPGQSGNIVLAGHSGGRAYPFNDLYYLEVGDPIVLWSNGQQYQYTVAERLVVDEAGPNVTLEQRRENARYIEPADQEVVTLVTCWPLTGPNKFNQRVIIRALPNRPVEPITTGPGGEPAGGWTAR